MRIIFVGGGTAGHINPALALAQYVKEKNPSSQILYVGAKGGMEENLVPKSGFDFKGITISGFSRKLNLDSIKKNIVTLKNIIISTFESRKILKEFKPDICVGTGGYVSGPFLREAANLKIPFIIHDSNSYPGITTKLLAKKANKVLIVNEEAKKHLPSNIEILVTGTPVRKKIATIDPKKAREKLNLNNNPVILSFGGSLGAETINKVISEIIIKYKNNSNYNFIHAYGKKGHLFVNALKNKGIEVKNNPQYIIKEYIDNMAECLAAADIVICRAGATTLSELQASKKPAILIPSPNVAENHQYYNAVALVNSDAASMIEEKNLTSQSLINEIEKILNSPEDIKTKYSKNLAKLAITDSTERIYEIIKNTINNK